MHDEYNNECVWVNNLFVIHTKFKSATWTICYSAIVTGVDQKLFWLHWAVLGGIGWNEQFSFEPGFKCA